MPPVLVRDDKIMGQPGSTIRENRRPHLLQGTMVFSMVFTELVSPQSRRSAAGGSLQEIGQRDSAPANLDPIERRALPGRTNPGPVSVGILHQYTSGIKLSLGSDPSLESPKFRKTSHLVHRQDPSSPDSSASSLLPDLPRPFSPVAAGVPDRALDELGEVGIFLHLLVTPQVTTVRRAQPFSHRFPFFFRSSP